MTRSGLTRGIIATSLAVVWALCLIGSAASASAQAIESLTVEGDPGGLTLAEIKRLSGAVPGQPLDRARIRQGLQALYDTGRFQDILIDAREGPEGVALTYTFIRRLRVDQVRFIGGFHPLRSRRLQEVLGIHPGQEWTPEVRQAGLGHLLDYFHRNGYLHPDIRSRITSDRGRTILEIQVRRGPRSEFGKVSFSGNRYFSDLFLAVNFRASAGDPYTADAIEEGLRRLEQSYHRWGYFLARIGPPEIKVRPGANAVDVNVPIQSGPHVVIRFEGSTVLSDRKLLSEVLIPREASLEEGVLHESVLRIRDRLRREGYLFAEVTVKRSEAAPPPAPEPEEVQVVFQITSGPYVSLSGIDFEGNSHFDTQRLRRLMKTRPSGWFRSRTLDRGILAEDLEAIRTLYNRAGFLDPTVETEEIFSQDRRRVNVTVRIQEGVQTIVRSVRFAGLEQVTQAEVEPLLRLRPGLSYDEVEARQDRSDLLTHYYRLGYPYAEGRLSTSFSPDRSGVDIAYEVHENLKVRIGEVTIQGNRGTSTHVIRRELRLRPGDPLTQERLLIAQQRLYRLGLFRHVLIEPADPEKREEVKDIRVTVEERPAGSIDFALGYGDIERVRGSVEVAHRNLLGTGRRASVRADGSSIEERYQFTYTEPWLFGLPVEPRFGITSQTLNKPTLPYDVRTLGSTVGVEHAIRPTVHTALLYEYDSHQLLNVEPQAVVPPEDEERVIASLNPSIAWDRRDDPFNPSRGFLHTLTFRDAARILGSQTQLVKLTLQTSWYHPLTSYMVLAFSTRSGVAERFGETLLVPPTERFLLGGRSRVRGYEEDSLGIPGETLDASGKPVGGNAMLMSSLEARLALPGNVGIVFFVDGGNVWLRYRDVALSEVKYSTGTGLRYNTPVGPFRLDWGYKLEREPGQDPWKLHFTLGHAF